MGDMSRWIRVPQENSGFLWAVNPKAEPREDRLLKPFPRLTQGAVGSDGLAPGTLIRTISAFEYSENLSLGVAGGVCESVCFRSDGSLSGIDCCNQRFFCLASDRVPKN